VELPEHLRRPTVRPAEPADLEPLAGAMARAFSDDPALGFLLGDERRPQRLEMFFEAELRLIAFPHEIVWTTDDLSAGAIWARPGHWRVPVGPTLRELPAMVRVFGARLPLAFWTRMRMEAKHPKPPSYYLAAIGVDPVAQGKGLGSELMAPMLEQIDAEGAGGYLEASTRRSRALYERHGFVQTGEIRLPRGGPSIWPMWRDPRV
jgi:ribosomal protein S18 acetylase RimI-like enzyme